MADRIELLEKGDESRVAVVAETKRKRKSSAVKKSKRKYKLLEAAKSNVVTTDEKEAIIKVMEHPKQPTGTS